MKKKALKITAVLLLLLVLGTSMSFIIYPNYSMLKIKISEINSTKISNNTFLNIFSTISYPAIEQVSNEQGEMGTLEHLPKEELEEYKKEHGVVELEREKTTLIIKSADIRGRIVDGDDANAMERGFWYFPLSPPPGKQGNTVIIGHRFLNIPPRRDTFFNLDAVKIGDKIIIEQRDIEYSYTVINIRVADKNDTSILANTNDYRITLITCTPLWTADERLVIIGKMDKVYGII